MNANGFVNDSASLASRLCLVAGLSLVALAVGASPLTTASYTDQYQGVTPIGYTDVIGNADWFGIAGAEVSIDGSVLQIDILTNFMVNGLGKYPNYTQNGLGIGAGDLFLSTLGWNPVGAAPHVTDNLTAGTVWTHALVLDNRWSASGGSASLVELPYLPNAGSTPTNGGYILTADAFMTGNAIWRHEQPVAVNTAATGVVDTGITGSWAPTTIAGNTNALRFSVDLAGTGLLDQPLGVSWGMTCSNDVIQFDPPGAVPEPGVLWLLTLGLPMLAGRRARA